LVWTKQLGRIPRSQENSPSEKSIHTNLGSLLHRF
jgi:hypothetical protein